MQRRFLLILALVPFVIASLAARQTEPVRSALIITAGTTDLHNPAHGNGRQLATLLGHFDLTWTLKGVQDYQTGELNAYDNVFYIGFDVRDPVPDVFTNDVLSTNIPVIWLNTGMLELCRKPGVARRLGFTVARIDSVSKIDQVQAAGVNFRKIDPHLAMIQILSNEKVTVLATASHGKANKKHPYAVRSGNLTYFGDSPFAYAAPGGHYLFFADYLHDLLRQPHTRSTRAMIRIEDVTLFESPDKLRTIADHLFERNIPFMIGVIPFFVDPAKGTNLSLSDKPELVDALQYMVQKGGTIVMHGVTHQYRGTTAADFEFWDASAHAPIAGQTEEEIGRKIEKGIAEFMSNGLYPLAWETPHYTASFALYRTVARYFSTVCEHRLALENEKVTQFFPYVIKKDIFGQTIYPENLGYVPLGPTKQASWNAIENILAGAAIHRSVRDGIATVFFHAFLDIDLLDRLVAGIENLGYAFVDMRDETHLVRTADRIIATGSQTISRTLDDQYLHELWFGRDGEIISRQISNQRIRGEVTKEIALQKKEFYVAEQFDHNELTPTVFERMDGKKARFYRSAEPAKEGWVAGRVRLLWNPSARGASFRDQASFASVFQSVHMPIDTVILGKPFSTAGANIVVIPFASADSLSAQQITVLGQFVAGGGNLVMDGHTRFSAWFGVRFTNTNAHVRQVRDKLFPEERIVWPIAERMTYFNAANIDRVFSSDAASDLPVVVGLRYGKGRVLFINGRFDPLTNIGTSHHPFFLEYVKTYFRTHPVIRSEQLEMYFDPGFRHDESLDSLVRVWVEHGVRFLHVAAWHEYPGYSYDYARLISLAHANGILAYAWIEPPQVSEKFWREHPEWREKNINGEDVRPSWRSPVAMTDPECVNAMVEEYGKLLRSYDWDGVNLAELYFEAGSGFEEPDLFTPAHPTARAAIRDLIGVDLSAVFDPASSHFWRRNASVRTAITNYRVDIITELHRRFLEAFKPIAGAKSGFDIVVTAMDELGSPELREHIGVDMNGILALQKDFGFVLQVEDPQSRWSTSPLRYAEIGAKYQERISSPDRLMLDLNILNFREQSNTVAFPTLIQTGTESFQLVRSAGIGAPRVAVYSESSVNPQDLFFLSSSLAANVEARWHGDTVDVSSPSSFTLKLPKVFNEIAVDGLRVLPARDDRFFIPAGSHQVILRSVAEQTLLAQGFQPRLLSSTGNVESISYSRRTLALTYDCRTRMLISISNIPISATVDGRAVRIIPAKGNDCYSLFLPSGCHTAVINVGAAFDDGVFSIHP